MSGNKQLPIWCWDTCVFFAWFGEETDKPLETIELAIKDIESGKAVVYVPTIVVHEVLVDAKGTGVTDAFLGFLKGDNVLPVSVDFRVAELGAKIRRESIQANRRAKKNRPGQLKTPDALILATAIVYGATAVHTFDPDMLRARGSRSLLDLTIENPVPVSGQRALKWNDE